MKKTTQRIQYIKMVDESHKLRYNQDLPKAWVLVMHFSVKITVYSTSRLPGH